MAAAVALSSQRSSSPVSDEMALLLAAEIAAEVPQALQDRRELRHGEARVGFLSVRTRHYERADGGKREREREGWRPL
jgi:hypothetical protein